MSGNSWSKSSAIAAHSTEVDASSLDTNSESRRRLSKHSYQTSSSISSCSATSVHSATPFHPSSSFSTGRANTPSCSSSNNDTSILTASVSCDRTKMRNDSVVSASSLIVSAEVHQRSNSNGSGTSSSPARDASIATEEKEAENKVLPSPHRNDSATECDIAKLSVSISIDCSTCQICLFEIDFSDAENNLIKLPCEHNTCYSCWCEYVKLQLNRERKCIVECPVYQCCHKLSSAKISKLIDSMKQPILTDFQLTEIYQLEMNLEDNKVDRFVEVCDDLNWCSSPNCGLAVKLPAFLHKRPVSLLVYSGFLCILGNFHLQCMNLYYSINSKSSVDTKSAAQNEEKAPLDRSDSSVIETVSVSSQPHKHRTKNTFLGISYPHNPEQHELKIISDSDLCSVSVQCANEHYFCWSCRGEGHQPASCNHWARWFEKIDQVKPNQVLPNVM